MFDTVTERLGLPMLQPAQAQKHVTVNESLARLDGLVNLVLMGTSRTAPPASAADGTCFGVGPGAVDAWAGHAGDVAIAAGGGWLFWTPTAGMQALNALSGRPVIHDGEGWVEGALTLGSMGAGMVGGLAELEALIGPGTEVVTALDIPAGAMVVGVTARVTSAITGTLGSWSIGTAGAQDRFGSGLGLAPGSWARGILSSPMTYWESEPLRLTATGGAFAGGAVRLALHWWELRLPRS